MINFFKNVFTKSNGLGKTIRVTDTPMVAIIPPVRQTFIQENLRRAYATELIDTYDGFGRPFLAEKIKNTVRSVPIRTEMINLCVCLPLLKHFIDSISRIYNQQPIRKFILNGKEIVRELPDDNQDSAKFIVDEVLYDTLNKQIYNDAVLIAIKQAERMTNLLNTAIYKAITNEEGQIEIRLIPNDLIQVIPDRDNDPSKANQIAFVRDLIPNDSNSLVQSHTSEIWTADERKIPNLEDNINDYDVAENEAAKAYESLFGYKKNGALFAPFVVFRSTGISNDFWNNKDNDVIECIKSINLSMTELRYLQKFASFGLKYAIGLKPPAADCALDPTGLWLLSPESSSVPGSDGAKNWEVGEFQNAGRIKDVIDSIIFNMKMLFSMYALPLDALVATNSDRSAESKAMDNEELFDKINSQRQIWKMNEKSLFKTCCAVWNRDSKYQLPKGLEIQLDFEEKSSKEKTVEDWMVEIENNVSSVLDWLSELNPDLNRDELRKLLASNEDINEQNKPESPIMMQGDLAQNGNPKPPAGKPPIDSNINENDDSIDD